MKICFLYIDEPYNIYHSIGIATQLSETDSCEVYILCTERNHIALSEILDHSQLSKLHLQVIRPFWYFTLPHYLEIKLQFRFFLYQRYAKLLSSFDGIICSLYNDLLLKRFVGHSQTKLIFAGHGVANRTYSYSDKITGFDHLLLAGHEEESIRQMLNQLDNTSYDVVGYLKFSTCIDIEVESPFKNELPIVLYNPHWLSEYSSYYKHGLSILKQFSESEEYNLIIAPHSLLTTRNPKIKREIEEFRRFDNIHIDFGSSACHDMTYLKLADYYLGDGSSQALEYLLIRSRPCLFIDIQDLRPQDYEFHSWRLGDVISNTQQIADKLATAEFRHHSYYQQIHEESIEKIFYKSNKPTAELAAESIINYLMEAS